MKVFHLSLLLPFLALIACNQKSGDVDLNKIPVTGDAGMQYLNQKGEVVLQAGTESSSYFSNGFAKIKKGQKYGFINKKGETVIEAVYKSASSFHEGIAWVVKENGYIEAINTKGELLFTLEQAESVNRYYEGLAVFETIDKEGKTLYGCVDKSGEITIQPQKNKIHNFHQKKALVINTETYKYGYIDKEGNNLINCQFDYANNFDENDLACVRFGDKWGIIDAEGKYVLNPQFEELEPDGDWFIVTMDGRVGWCDKSGKYSINPQFEMAQPFEQNDLAPVHNGTKWGYINRKGEMKINPQFDYATPFLENNIAIVKLNEKFGFINKEGKYIVNPQFENINEYFILHELYEEYYCPSVHSDYFDTNVLVNRLKEIITDTSIDGIPYTTPIQKLMNQFQLKESSFSKHKENSVLLKTGKLAPTMEYTLAINGNPWERSSGGWFSSYNFNPNYVPNSYSMTITLDWKHENKTEPLLRALSKALMPGSPPKEKIEERRTLSDYDEQK